MFSKSSSGVFHGLPKPARFWGVGTSKELHLGWEISILKKPRTSPTTNKAGTITTMSHQGENTHSQPMEELPVTLSAKKMTTRRVRIPTPPEVAEFIPPI